MRRSCVHSSILWWCGRQPDNSRLAAVPVARPARATRCRHRSATARRWPGRGRRWRCVPAGRRCARRGSGTASDRSALPNCPARRLPGRAGGVRAVEEQPGLAHGVVVVAEAGAEEVVFRSVQLADRLGDAQPRRFDAGQLEGAVVVRRVSPVAPWAAARAPRRRSVRSARTAIPAASNTWLGRFRATLLSATGASSSQSQSRRRDAGPKLKR